MMKLLSNSQWYQKSIAPTGAEATYGQWTPAFAWTSESPQERSRVNLRAKVLNRIFIAVLLLLSLTMAAHADRALLIAINEYDRDQGVTPLKGAVNDAIAMRKFLIDNNIYAADDILMIQDDQATRTQILRSIEDWLIAGTQTAERAFLYYSGHGSYVRSLSEEGESDQVLVPVDSYFDANGKFRNIIRDKELSELLDKLRDRQVTLVVDSCYSGDIVRSAAPHDPQAAIRSVPNPNASRATGPHPGQSLVEARPGLTVWTAASATQPAWETTRDGKRAGVFTTAWVNGLDASSAGGGTLNRPHLDQHNWLIDESKAACDRISGCLSLTPTLEVARSLQFQPVSASLASVTGPQMIDTAALAQTLLQAPQAATPVSSANAGSASAGKTSVQILSEQSTPTNQIREGDVVRFSVQAGFDGYLTLIDINSKGEATQLFPNEYSQTAAKIFGSTGNKVSAAIPVVVPEPTYGFEITVTGPFGDGVLVAVVTSDPVDLSDTAPASRSFLTMGPDASRDYLLRLREKLRAPFYVDSQEVGFERQLRFDVATFDYRSYAN